MIPAAPYPAGTARSPGAAAATAATPSSSAPAPGLPAAPVSAAFSRANRGA
nr:hypothetical protein [Human alphaherpesvirus 1]